LKLGLDAVNLKGAAGLSARRQAGFQKNPKATAFAQMGAASAGNQTRIEDAVGEKPNTTTSSTMAALRSSTAGQTSIQEPLPANGPGSGRLVWNHSTHLPGLIDALKRLRDAHRSIKTIVPGQISAGLAHRPALTLEKCEALQHPERGFRCVARVGGSCQEVLFVLEEGACVDSTIAAIQGSMESIPIGLRVSSVARDQEARAEGRAAAGFVLLANPNRDTSAEDERRRKAAQKAKHERESKALRDAADQRSVEERKRKLRASAAAYEKGFDKEAAAKEWSDAAAHGIRGKRWGK
jgi:hypothetical protein